MGSARETTSTSKHPVVSHVVAFLKARESELEGNLKDVRNALPTLSGATDAGIRYQVDLKSLWADEGEKSVSITQKSSLAAAVRKAAKQFKRINNRSDVQAKWRVYALVGDRDDPLMIAIPESLWADAKREFV